jgi:hypothetical protein
MGQLMERLRKKYREKDAAENERARLEEELARVKRAEREEVAELRERVDSICARGISPAARAYLLEHGKYVETPVVAGDLPLYRGEAETVKPVHRDACATCGAVPHTQRWVVEGDVYCLDCGIPASVGVGGTKEVYLPGETFSWRKFSELCSAGRKREAREAREELKALQKRYRLKQLNLSKKIEALPQ